MMNARQRQQLLRARRSGSVPSVRSPMRAQQKRMLRSECNSHGNDSHPLANVHENGVLHAYEQQVKNAFDNVIPALKQISALQHDADFEFKAQAYANKALGFELPQTILSDAWVQQLDMKRLFAWCLFETYKRYSDAFFSEDPLGCDSQSENDFDTFLQDCGFHTFDISPCADGRLAHVIRYVLRLPYRMVRRKSYAGALFDIEDSLAKWVETELKRFREGKPDTADSLTRYLKCVVYHHSSVDPEHEGCAAHGSDTTLAAKAGIERLVAFKQAIENTHCCGASIDYLLIGLDTDTDTIRIHMPENNGDISLQKYIDAGEIYQTTKSMSADAANHWITEYVQNTSAILTEGMVAFIVRLLINNFSQIEYVKNYYGTHYEDIGHAERFIGAGIGFEEVQLRNLTYFAYLNTVEEATQDLDVGIKIFNRLNVQHGLPVPIVVRYDYHGNVPGSRERAIQQCKRVAAAINNRFEKLRAQGFLHTLLAIRDVNASAKIEILECSVNVESGMDSH